VELSKKANSDGGNEPTAKINSVVTLGGDVALEKIKECHNEIILNKMAAKSGGQSAASAFGKHYSVNIRPNIV
jgi:hypothetical protein